MDFNKRKFSKFNLPVSIVFGGDLKFGRLTRIVYSCILIYSTYYTHKYRILELLNQAILEKSNKKREHSNANITCCFYDGLDMV